ncbi:MAG: cyclopropane-fatty-acyl-phospholipid synthase family protein [bacterium]|nr:cyclopropane-fatty-acyl-phospholipid synthase family protein [bacterium]
MSQNIAQMVESRKQNSTRSFTLTKLLRRMLHQQLSKIRYGSLWITDEFETVRFGIGDEIVAKIRLHSLRFYEKIIFGGSIGAAESYMDGDWESEDLVATIRLMVRNRDVLEGLEGGLAFVTNFLHRLYHLWNRNTIKGSKQNILAHYDLGNDFYQLFLDETMTYSCGIFENETTSLKEASIAKYDRLCKKLQLTPNDHVLEIGCGWGSFAVYAAENYSCRVTTTTISEAQYAYVQALIREKGLDHKITLLKQDYRQLEGKFDKLVSIEMIEAVGHQYLGEYLQQCSRLLKPKGVMALQAITIPDQVYPRYRKSTDFIQRYIFPGSCLISISHLLREIQNRTDLRLVHLEDIGIHYAKTLHAWRNNFHKNEDKVKALGFSDSFIRMWDYYFAYCEGGFAEHFISNSQLVFRKSQSDYDTLPILGGSV